MSLLDSQQQSQSWNRQSSRSDETERGDILVVPMETLSSICPDSIDGLKENGRGELDGQRNPLRREDTIDSEDEELQHQNNENLVTDDDNRVESIDGTQTEQRKAFNANTYAGKKTITQGMLDVALLTANSSYLKLLCKQHIDGNTPYFFHLLVFLLASSIFLQLVTGILLFFKFRYNITKTQHQRKADIFNNMATVIVMVITIINIFIASFSDLAPGTKIASTAGENISEKPTENEEVYIVHS
ncbi:ninjurin-2-like [Glandiceps talaboti]